MNHLDEIRSEIKKYKTKIKFKKHALVRILERKVDPELVKNHLENPDKLVDAILQESENINEKKYKLLFELSRNRKLAVVVVLKEENLYVVTVFIKYRKWDKMVRRWPKKYR